jgi:DNA polymerase-3 subunit gamma/tau
MSEVLALKYRPQTFDEVIGQEQTVKQLTAALDTKTLGHALLFYGTRGTGKTTSARIVARELNRDYPEIYENWEQRNHLVLTELDAASNNGVDHIREIIDNIRYQTVGHRVVILDEAHMLTRQAFNAFLKTLEEPPERVTFILLTTEPNKLPATIKSRCQTYEFHEVPVETLKSYYASLVEKEGFDFDVEAVALKAEGSVRDGLSILQKSLSGEVEEDTSRSYFDLVGALYAGDVATALGLVQELRKAEDARIIIQTLEKWFYWCSLESFGQKTPIRPFFEDQADLQFDLSHLQRLFDTCLDIERAFNATPNSKVVLDMGIMKLCL